MVDVSTVLNYLHNYFIKTVIDGTFDIVDFTLSIPQAKNGQCVMIEGSDLNDGIYMAFDGKVSDLMADEEFDGTISLLAIPNDLMKIIEQIIKFDEANQKTLKQSESFGGYSYSIASDKNGGIADWRTAFKNDLRRWVKL